jgi:hypothetical protein
MGVPVRRGGLNGLANLLPRFKTAAFARPRPQHFPPRFDQVEIGRVDRLKDALPAGMGQGKQPDVGGMLDVEIVQNRADRLSLWGHPDVDMFQELYPIGNGTPA